MKDLSGKTAVITGGANGIGRGLTIACADAGMNVVVADVDEDEGRRAAAEAAERGIRSRFVATDVADLVAVRALADAAYAEFDAVHLLCNNAGVVESGWIRDLTLEDWQWIINVNVWGAIHGLLAFLPRMREQVGEKHILNTGSTASYIPVTGLGSYNTTKFAVAGLTETLRGELAGEGIGVTMFCPGTTATEIRANSIRVRDKMLGTRREPPSDLVERFQDRRVDLDERPMDVVDVARMALQGVKDNLAFVFTHPTPRRVETAQQRFASILAAFPGEPTSLA
jgi:NAD(P)-dependent dehydrogenase (short-subunit alcohol dehydrogenase family)